MNKNKLIELIDSNGRFNLPTTELEHLADYLISNGIGDITAEKHRADLSEEALKLAVFDYKACVENEVCKKYKTKAEEILYIREQTEIEMDKILSMLKEKK